ncbi:MAG: hypothetical protein ACRDXE_08070 [Acidimicrobiales bacterium]
MESYRISAEDRGLFKRCRRAWDFGARSRRALRPKPEDQQVSRGPGRLEQAVGKALDVYYYPGMWAWDRSIVVPLVHRALDEALRPPGAPAAEEGEVAAGHALLDAYAAWAPTHDHFTPVQVATEIAVNVADPVISDDDLTTPDGVPVSYATWLDALVVDDDNRPWLLRHRVGNAPFMHPDVAALDETALTDAWAWEVYSLYPRMAGVLFTEVMTRAPASTGREAAGPPFRRHVVGYSREELAAAGRQLAREALDMTDPGLALYPNPTIANCGGCAFRDPCRIMRAGGDPGPVLDARYEPRPEAPLVEGRLGGHTWSMNRGARPNRFGE